MRGIQEWATGRKKAAAIAKASSAAFNGAAVMKKRGPFEQKFERSCIVKKAT